MALEINAHFNDVINDLDFEIFFKVELRYFIEKYLSYIFILTTFGSFFKTFTLMSLGTLVIPKH